MNNTKESDKACYLKEINSFLDNLFAKNEENRYKFINFTHPIYAYKVVAINCNNRQAVCIDGNKLLEDLPNDVLAYIYYALNCGKFTLNSLNNSSITNHLNDCYPIRWFDKYKCKAFSDFNIHRIVNPLICTNELMSCILFYGWNEFESGIKHSNIEIDTDCVKVYVNVLSCSEYITSMNSLGKIIKEFNPMVFSGSFGYINNSNKKVPPYFIFYFTEAYQLHLKGLKNNIPFPMKVQLSEEDILKEKLNNI